LGLRADEFLSIFKADGLVKTLAEGISTSKANTIRLKGVSGSLDAILFSSVFKSTKSDHLIILHDKEEASYFFNDLQNLLGQREILFFPMSYKRPYEYDGWMCRQGFAAINMQASVYGVLSQAWVMQRQESLDHV